MSESLLKVKKPIIDYFYNRAKSLNEDAYREFEEEIWNKLKVSPEDANIYQINKTLADYIKKFFGISNYAIFFLSTPPKDSEDLTKFRRSDEEYGISKYIFQYIQKIEEKRELYLDLLDTINEGYIDYKEEIKKIYKGSITIKSDPLKIAQAFRYAFDNLSFYDNKLSAEKFYNRIAYFLENLGYLVYMTNTNSHERGFSGLYIAKEKYPLIAIFYDYSIKRANFTLLHEFAHSLLGSSIIDNYKPDLSSDKQPEEETWCNKFAAEFLMPTAEIENIKGISSYNNLKKEAERFFVSVEALLYKLKPLNIISKEDQEEYLQKAKRKRDNKNNDKEIAPRRLRFEDFTMNGITQLYKFLYAHERRYITYKEINNFSSTRIVNFRNIKDEYMSGEVL